MPSTKKCFCLRIKCLVRKIIFGGNLTTTFQSFMSLNTIRVCFLYDYVKGNKISDATNLVANWRERKREREKGES